MSQRLVRLNPSPRTSTATFDASGVAEIDFGAPAPGQAWEIERLVVSVAPTGGPSTEARVYVGGTLGDDAPGFLRDGTSRGNLDVGDQASPILAMAGENVRLRWTGGTPGDTATGHLQLWIASIKNEG